MQFSESAFLQVPQMWQGHSYSHTVLVTLASDTPNRWGKDPKLPKGKHWNLKKK